jgi:hypothetical protein
VQSHPTSNIQQPASNTPHLRDLCRQKSRFATNFSTAGMQSPRG